MIALALYLIGVLVVGFLLAWVAVWIFVRCVQLVAVLFVALDRILRWRKPR